MPLVWLQFKCHAYSIWTNQIIHNNAVRGVPLFAVIPYNSFFCIKQRGGFTSIQTISFYKLDYDGCVLPCLKRQWFNTNRDKYSFVPLRWLIRNVTYYLHFRHSCRRRRQEGYTFCVNIWLGMKTSLSRICMNPFGSLILLKNHQNILMERQPTCLPG